jgi:hypothetical protein
MTAFSVDTKIASKTVRKVIIPSPFNHAGKTLGFVGRSTAGRQYLNNLRRIYPLPKEETDPSYPFLKALRDYLRLTE